MIRFVNYIVVVYLGLASVHCFSSITVTDIAGRTVTIDRPAKKVVLGEGRFMSIFSVLQIEKPVDRIAGMMNELKTYDPATYRAYQNAFPEIDLVPTFGHTSEDSVSVEKILLLDPDLAIFGVSGHGPTAKSTHIIKRLEKAGIPIVFIDFRKDPIRNTAKSVEIVGDLLGVGEKAKEFSDYYKQKLQLISERVRRINPELYPSVLIDLRASLKQACCVSVAEGLFADMVEFSGGVSMASGVLPGPVGQLSHEYILSSEFDIYIGTAIGSESKDGTQTPYLLAGVGVDSASARTSLNALLARRKFSNIRSVNDGKAYVLWHHFYNSPYNLYAIESMAKWFHPQWFTDLSPETTLKKFLSGVESVSLYGAYSASLYGDK